MSCKIWTSVLLVIAVLSGGPTYIYANTNDAPEDCKTVAECVPKETKDDSSKEHQEQQEQPQLKQSSDVSTVGTTLKVLFALAFVVALLIIILKLLHKRTQVIQQGKGIQTLGGAMLGNQRSVQLVKIGKRILVVGVGDNVELIKEIEDPDEIATFMQMNEGISNRAVESEGLSSWINKLLTKQDGSRNSDFKQILNKQLADSKKNRKSILESLRKGQDND
ncbi:flagellar biosynthetic protein FliO [Pseudalkalibacillus berkeleyi]|uniref:Flagellar biosynthetic protein FliO n=1 Tax=Pseudalkalibacillus berkeleyi TaxID=1069813 RepID=A0ABS9GWG1_9BACL|nr:flagellar biosynthetic protein FliO [Pseudalkalibacillus berkeleyi]MCF6137119.1 flagellar biosynthetic protein FliO [Pseudalkalibacillus berkeleyi]